MSEASSSIISGIGGAIIGGAGGFAIGRITQLKPFGTVSPPPAHQVIINRITLSTSEADIENFTYQAKCVFSNGEVIQPSGNPEQVSFWIFQISGNNTLDPSDVVSFQNIAMLGVAIFIEYNDDGTINQSTVNFYNLLDDESVLVYIDGTLWQTLPVTCVQNIGTSFSLTN
jgi:hypothetical protein